MDFTTITEINEIFGLTWQEKLDYLSNCNCCMTHQINKPKKFQTWVDTPFSQWYNQKQCQCACRHLSRMICRQTDDYAGFEVVGEAEEPTTPKSVIR